MHMTARTLCSSTAMSARPKLGPGAVAAAPLLWHPHRNASRKRMAACADCLAGSLDEGTPKGEDSTLAGVPCYISKPSSPNECAVIVATDIFGYKLVNSRLIADVYADNGFLTVVPDYFQGEPMNIALLETYEALPSMSLLGKLGGYAQLAGQIVGMGSWFKRHPVEYAISVVAAVAAELRQQHCVQRVGLQGYCYGGKVGVMMAAKPESVDAVCSAHPGLIRIPEDIQDVQVPLQFICAASDAQFPEKTRTAAQQLLQQKAPGLGRFILYPGTKHGFAVRGSRADPSVNAAREDALKQGLGFFKQHLAGVQPPVQAQGAAAAAAKPVGVVLTP